MELARRLVGWLLHSLSFKLSFSAGLIIFLVVMLGAWFNFSRQHRWLESHSQREAAGFAETVRRATYWSMLRNQRESLHQIILDMAGQPGVERVRVFNKEGEIMFSSLENEIGQRVDMKAEACYGCHAESAPLTRLPTSQRTRIFQPTGKHRVLSTILPIYNEPACSTPACHAHPPGKNVLGVLDVSLSLARVDALLEQEFKETLAFASFLFISISTFIGMAIILNVNRSVKRLVAETDKVTSGELDEVRAVEAPDELGQIATSFNRMTRAVVARVRAQDRLYRQLIDNSTDAVLLLDAKGEVLLYNQEAARILGTGQQTLTRADLERLLSPPDRAEMNRLLNTLDAHGQASALVQFQVLAQDGAQRVVEGRFRGVRDEKGASQVLANLRDVTRRQALASELDRRRAFERQLIQQALNAVIATDESGVVNTYNQSACLLFGYESQEVIGKMSYAQFFPRAQVSLLKHNLFEHPQPEASLVRAVVVKTKDGSRLPAMLSVRTLFMEGKFSGAVFFLQNLREAKHLKAQLLRKTRLAGVGETAAGLAHCMKNLFHGLGTSTYLVDQGLAEQDLELTAQGWGMVKKNLDQLSGLSQDLLSYARDRRPQYQPFNLNNLLEECRLALAGRWRDLGIQVEVLPDPSCQRVVLDPLGMKRVIVNLLTNALDALEESPPTGATPMVRVACGRDGYGQVWIAVSDNGPGLNPEVQNHLFGGLYSTKGSKGTGLGLLVSQKIVEEHGGAIQAVNLPDGGARFTLAVPDLSGEPGS